jgi:hypothetical protein
MIESAQIDQATLLKLVRDVEAGKQAAENAVRICERIETDMAGMVRRHDGLEKRTRDLEVGQAQTRTWGTAGLILLGIAQAALIAWIKR